MNTKGSDMGDQADNTRLPCLPSRNCKRKVIHVLMETKSNQLLVKTGVILSSYRSFHEQISKIPRREMSARRFESYTKHFVYLFFPNDVAVYSATEVVSL